MSVPRSRSGSSFSRPGQDSSCRWASSCVAATESVPSFVRVISPGSRPTSAQWRVEDAHQVADVIGSAEDVAGVGVLGDEAERLPLAAAADEDRDVAADRPRVVVRAVDPVVRALDGRLLLREHRARDAERVLEQLEAHLQRREVEAVGAVLALEPGGAERVDRAAAGEDVQRRRDLRVEGRVAVGDAADHQAEVQPLGAPGERGEGGVPLEHPLGLLADAGDLVQVIHDEQRVEARRSPPSRAIPTSRSNRSPGATPG